MDEPDEDTLQRVCEAFYERRTAGPIKDGIEILDVYQHDAINFTFTGTVEVEGQTYGYIIDDGNWNGTVVRAWGDHEDVGYYEHPDPPEPWTFIPNNNSLQIERPGMFKVYLEWRKQPWFTDKERGYNYDRFFAPGGKTESYYRDWAATKGMRIGKFSSLTIMTDEEAAQAHLDVQALVKMMEADDAQGTA